MATTYTLLFADDRQPIAHLTVELRDGDTVLGRGETDDLGQVVFDVPGTHLVGFDDGQETFRATAEAQPVEVRFWGYHRDRPVARAAPNDTGRTDQGHSSGYLRVLGASLAGVDVGTQRLKARIGAGEWLGLAEVQAEYPETLPQRIDRYTGHSRSGAWLGELALNGFNTALLCRDAEGLVLPLHWGDVPEDPSHDLSDAELRLVDTGDGLQPTSIRLRTRIAGAWGNASWVTHRPADPSWSAAKRVFRCQWLLSGALDAHIIRTHLLVEQFAIAAFRHLRRSPLRALLAPHLAEVVAADTDADQFAWGPDGQIPNGSALKFPIVEARMQEQLGGMDWWGWRPRAPVAPHHKYARLLRIYWEMVGDYVEAFFAAHAAEICREWVEVRRFSDDLVGHSPRYSPPRPAVGDFVDTAELPRSEAPRRTVGGVLRAITPVTASDCPAEGELDGLRQLCCYLVTQATFVHSWVHDGQYDAGGDIRFASLSLRNGSLGDEDDDTIGVVIPEAIAALVTNANGLGANYGFLLANEEGDVPEDLRRRLLQVAPSFAALGFDIRRIRSRINI